MKLSALVLAPVAALCFAQPAAAQLTASSAWQPWHGCWRANDAPADETLCIVPDGAGVRMVTLSNGVVRADSRIIADGQPRRSDRDGCSSTEIGRWSADRRRVFLNSETSCDGDVTRDVSGMLAFIEPTEWLSVQTVTGNDGAATRSVRFTRVANVPAMIAPALRGTVVLRSGVMAPIAEEDVSEAMRYVDAAAVQEWLRSADAPFEVASGSQSESWSALDQMGRVSRDVQYVERDVVRIIERPVYVVRSYGHRRYSSCWTPWGYDHYGWRAGPIIRISLPIIINRGHSGRYGSRDWSRDRYDRYDRYDRWDRYDRYDRDRSQRDRDDYGRDSRDRDSGSRDGRVTRNGYTNRDRSGSERQPSRAISGSTRTVRREPARATSGSTRGGQRAPAAASTAGSRTAQPRSGRN
jgi:hypothetical protein